MPDLAELQRRIIATKAALDGARAGYEHSPNAETQRIVEGVEQTLNVWLEEWAEQRVAEEIVSA